MQHALIFVLLLDDQPADRPDDADQRQGRAGSPSTTATGPVGRQLPRQPDGAEQDDDIGGHQRHEAPHIGPLRRSSSRRRRGEAAPDQPARAATGTAIVTASAMPSGRHVAQTRSRRAWRRHSKGSNPDPWQSQRHRRHRPLQAPLSLVKHPLQHRLSCQAPLQTFALS